MKKLILLLCLILGVGVSMGADYTSPTYTNNTNNTSANQFADGFVCFLSDCTIISTTYQAGGTCYNWALTNLSGTILKTGVLLSGVATINYSIPDSLSYFIWIYSGTTSTPASCRNEYNNFARNLYNTGLSLFTWVRSAGNFVFDSFPRIGNNSLTSISYSGTIYGPPTPPTIRYNGIA